MGSGVSTEATKGEGYQAVQDGAQTPEIEAIKPSALIICGPSGVGKGTLIKKLSGASDRFGFSCSHTTRAPRPGETHGSEYYFTKREDFERGIEAGEFLEFAHVHNNIYGTSIKAVTDVGDSGRCCILDIDVQGARKVRASGLKAIFVFVAPPSGEELERRLRGRATESDDQVQARLAVAKQELESMNEPGLFDYIIFNDELEEAYQQLVSVAQRALAGQVGNGTRDGPVTLVAEAEASVGAIQDAARPQQGVTSQDESKQTSSSKGTQAPGTPSAVGSSAPPNGLARWQGKVALVTGASAGIGWAVCQQLALAGLRVVAVARRRERLEALQQHLVGMGVPIADFLPVVCDITKEAEVVALPRIIVKRWPGAGIDVLVNNAGMGRNNAALFDGKTASWVEMISTNVLGPCMCSREALLDMKRREQWGHIINISSMAAHRVPNAAESGSAFYAATKHALRALTEGLRQEARGRQVPLRVSSISPGVVETEFDAVRNYGDTQSAGDLYSRFQCLQAEDVAQAVLWALSAPDHVDVHDILMRPTAQVL